MDKLHTKHMNRYYERQQVLSELEKARMDAYMAATDTEAVLASAVNPDDRAELIRERNRWYDEATHLEAQIAATQKVGLLVESEADD